MVRSTNVLKQIFASIWSLVEIGAVLARVGKPLARHAWREYALSRSDMLATLVEHLTSSFGYEAEVAKLLVIDAPWSRGGGDLPDGDALAGEMVLIIGAAREDFPLIRTAPIEQLCRRGTVHQLAQLLDGLLLAKFEQCRGIRPAPVAQIESTMNVSVELATDQQSALRTGWRVPVVDEWRKSFLPRTQATANDQALLRWLKEATDGFGGS